MATKINDVPSKKPETETPIVESSGNVEEQKHKKMERAADRLAHKGNEDHQKYDQDHTKFSI